MHLPLTGFTDYAATTVLLQDSSNTTNSDTKFVSDPRRSLACVMKTENEILIDRREVFRSPSVTLSA